MDQLPSFTVLINIKKLEIGLLKMCLDSPDIGDDKTKTTLEAVARLERDIRSLLQAHSTFLQSVHCESDDDKMRYIDEAIQLCDAVVIPDDLASPVFDLKTIKCVHLLQKRKYHDAAEMLKDLVKASLCNVTYDHKIMYCLGVVMSKSFQEAQDVCRDVLELPTASGAKDVLCFLQTKVDKGTQLSDMIVDCLRQY